MQTPMWSKILRHCGKDLDARVKIDAWCRLNKIKTGQAYLKCWIALMFRNPERRLPLLYLHGPKASGKSLLHEAIATLIPGRSVIADQAIQSRFNDELANALLCVIQEPIQEKINSFRLIHLIMGETFTVCTRGRTPYQTRNLSHWIQVEAPDATRVACRHVTWICVAPPSHPQIKREILAIIEKENDAFANKLLRMKLPVTAMSAL